MTQRDRILGYLAETARVNEGLGALATHTKAAADMPVAALSAGNKMIFCGNGGSTADAFLAVREMGVRTIGHTGQSGGRTAALNGLLTAAPHDKTNHLQETHIAIGHLICALTEAALCSPRP